MTYCHLLYKIGNVGRFLRLGVGHENNAFKKADLSFIINNDGII